MEEEEALKKYTDCVYFLASHLTCNKGIECEYRHSEIAKLNPRDCWYWLAGSCLNPSCAFRHPPLEIHSELSSEFGRSQDQCSTMAKSVEVPCYFYFSGFCKKGDRCPFLHGTNDALKVSNTAAAISDAPLLDKKTSTGSHMVSGPVEKVPITSEAAPKLSAKSEFKPKEGINESDLKCQSASPHTSTFEFEEAPAARLDTLLDKEGSIRSESVMYTDQSSEEEVDAHSREDDWLESSPGFDVLVDDKSQNSGYEDDEDYLVAVDGNGGEFDGQFLRYNYEDCTEYRGTLQEEPRIDSCAELDDDIEEQRLAIVRSISRYDSEQQKRNFLPVKLPMDGLRGVDLRSYLRNGRVEDDPRLPCFSERNYSSPKMYRSHEKPRQFDKQRYSFGKLANNKRRFKATKSSGQLRKSHLTISRQHYKEKRQSKRPVYSSYISRRPVARKRRTEEYSAFSAPKTLDEIKEEKRRGTGNGHSYGNSGHFSERSEDFQGPKPLSEILKDKRKIRSVVDVNNGFS